MQLTKRQINHQARSVIHSGKRIVLSNIKLEMVKTILENPGCSVDDVQTTVCPHSRRKHLNALEKAEIIRYSKAFVGGRMVTYLHGDMVEKDDNFIGMPANIYLDNVCTPSKNMALIEVDNQRAYLSPKFVSILEELKIGHSYNAHQLSKHTGMSAGTAHNYLSALVLCGLVDPQEGLIHRHYRLRHGLLLDTSPEFHWVR